MDEYDMYHFPLSTNALPAGTRRETRVEDVADINYTRIPHGESLIMSVQ